MRGFFDSSSPRPWEYNSGFGGTQVLPAATPGSWPVLNAYNPDTIDYADPGSPPRPSGNYPLTGTQIGHFNDVHYLNSITINPDRPNGISLGYEWRENPRQAQWTAMVRGKDQLRQRLAFASD